MKQKTLLSRASQRIGDTLRNLQLSRSKLFQESTQIVLENIHLNIRRVTLLSMIALPVHIAVILQFLLSEAGPTPAEITWRHGIMIAHAVLLLMMITLYLISRQLRGSKEKTLLGRMIQHIMIIGILAGGVGITAVDQLITTNITPYLLACLLVGMVFLTRPLFSLIYSLIGYSCFFVLIAFNETSPDIILSNRVNGLVIAAIGFLIANMMWRYSKVNFRQNQRIVEQRQQLEQKNAELEQMAFFDSLTTLPNRRFFDEIIHKEIALIQRDAHQSCLIMLDIDHFKDVNDTYGHPAGDIILKQVSLLLKSCIRQSDLIARLGGEEFIILLPGTNMAGATAAAEKLRDAIEHMSFLVGSQAMQITASFGVARLAHQRAGQINYYAECDKALYKAKQNGRNRVETSVTA